MSPSKSSNITFDTFHNIVDGKQRGSKNIHNGIDPTNGNKLWDVPIASQQDVDDAVASASKAFTSWSQVPFDKRKEMMLKYSELLMSYKEEMTDLLCKETGKPVSTTAHRTYLAACLTPRRGCLPPEKSAALKPSSVSTVSRFFLKTWLADVNQLFQPR